MERSQYKGKRSFRWVTNYQLVLYCLFSPVKLSISDIKKILSFSCVNLGFYKSFPWKTKSRFWVWPWKIKQFSPSLHSFPNNYVITNLWFEITPVHGCVFLTLENKTVLSISWLSPQELQIWGEEDWCALALHISSKNILFSRQKYLKNWECCPCRS